MIVAVFDATGARITAVDLPDGYVMDASGTAMRHPADEDGGEESVFEAPEGGHLEIVAQPQRSDASIVAEATARIDAIADAVYTASPSRVVRYERKLDEARRYIAAGYPGNVALADYPALVQEAPARGLTKRQLADLIVEAAASFAQLAGFIEAQRAGLAPAVAGQSTPEAKIAAAEAIVAAVEAAAAAAA